MSVVSSYALPLHRARSGSRTTAAWLDLPPPDPLCASCRSSDRRRGVSSRSTSRRHARHRVGDARPSLRQPPQSILLRQRRRARRPDARRQSSGRGVRLRRASGIVLFLEIDPGCRQRAPPQNRSAPATGIDPRSGPCLGGAEEGKQLLEGIDASPTTTHHSTLSIALFQPQIYDRPATTQFTPLFQSQKVVQPPRRARPRRWSMSPQLGDRGASDSIG